MPATSPASSCPSIRAATTSRDRDPDVHVPPGELERRSEPERRIAAMPIEVGEPSFPLDDLSVVDLSVGIPGSYCTKLLHDGGADVVKIETSDGDALRRRPCGGIDPEPGSDSALFQYLAAGKRSVVADPDPAGEERILDLVRGADVI